MKHSFFSFSVSPRFSKWLKATLVVALLGVNLSLAYAWVAPGATPPNGNVGLKSYVSDCNLYASYGWASKNECRTDGRWHMVQDTMGNVNADLKQAIYDGAEIRVKWSGGGGLAAGAASAVCLSAFTYIYNGIDRAYCHENMRYGGSVAELPADDPFTIGNENAMYSFTGADPRPSMTWGHIGAQMLRSDGKTRSVTIVPRAETSDNLAYMKANIGSVTSLTWYARY